MYTKDDLLEQLNDMPIDETGTILVHSSMKSIGDVKGGADTVLDAFIEYMEDGLLVFPTHTWATVSEENPVFDVKETASHIGILTELFRHRPGVVRSLHPTHSVAALGKNAEKFVAGQEKFDTPAARDSVWGKLLDRKAQILLVGVDFRRNTFIHGIEEWLDIPGRIVDDHVDFKVKQEDGEIISTPLRRHFPGFSEFYWKVEDLLAEKGAIEYAQLGDAKVYVCDTVLLHKYISQMLKMDPDIFSDDEPLSETFKEEFRKQAE